MITSLLDNDLYQFSMSACLWQHGQADLRVRYEFRNRTFSVPLASRMRLDWLHSRVKDIQALRFTEGDIAFLRAQGIFPEGWLTWLKEQQLPDVTIGSDSGHLVMSYEGPVGVAIFWESILLALVNEHYFVRFGDYLGEGSLRLREKIHYLRERETIKFVEFGTRRRFSGPWQHYALHEMTREIPDLVLGTSNVALARDFDIPAIGTMAHQLFMIFTALEVARTPNRIRDAVAGATDQVLDMWADSYQDHPHMMTVLPDTYGTENFINLADKNLVRKYTSFRQDSGDPIEVGETLTAYSRVGLGQDETRIVFSDGLDVRSMSVIEDHFKRLAVTPFGWGTNLTNDLGYEPISIVIKPCAVQHFDTGEWLPCVKTSDDVRKATGDPATVNRYLEALLQ